MSPHEHDILRGAEEQYWWYAVLHRLVLKELRAHVPVGAQILDAGCGTGGMLARLGRWRAYGVDLSSAAIAHCQRRGLPRVTPADVCRLPFQDAAFDAVLSLDVLYHERVREESALAEMSRVLRPSGVMILNLPAFDCLRGEHDRAVCGTRRYKLCHVRAKLAAHNLVPMMTHYWNAWLFAPLWGWRCLSRLRRNGQAAPRSDLRPLPEAANAMLRHLSLLDAHLCRRLNLPFGSSIFAVAQKQEKPSHELRLP